MFDEIKKCVSLIDKIFPELKYIGIDFVVTRENKIKILEINSLPSLDGIQLYGPWHEVKKIK